MVPTCKHRTYLFENPKSFKDCNSTFFASWQLVWTILQKRMGQKRKPTMQLGIIIAQHWKWVYDMYLAGKKALKKLYNVHLLMYYTEWVHKLRIVMRKC